VPTGASPKYRPEWLEEDEVSVEVPVEVLPGGSVLVPVGVTAVPEAVSALPGCISCCADQEMPVAPDGQLGVPVTETEESIPDFRQP
jgi:hypothetical protein